MKATLEDLIKDFDEIETDKGPKIPYKLHEYFRMVQRHFAPRWFYHFLVKYRDERHETTS